MTKREKAEAPRREIPSAKRHTVAERVLFILRARPGQRPQDIRERLGLDLEELSTALDLLLAEGKITQGGIGGGKTYRPA